MTNLIVVDDHPTLIEGVKALLSTQSEVTITGTASNGKELLEQILPQTAADVVLLDVEMPVLNGLETTTLLRKEYPDIKILVFTGYDQAPWIKKMLNAGAHGYVLKTIKSEELLKAIAKLKAGEKYYDSRVVDVVLENYDERNQSRVKLTKREQEILVLIDEGYSTAEIAEKLFIATNTVDTHRKNLLSKFQVNNATKLLKEARQLGLID